MTESITNDVMLAEYLRWNAFLSKDNRLLYVSTPKVACSSLKWWFASLLGVEQTILNSVDSDEPDTDLIIHDLFPGLFPDVTGLPLVDLIPALTSDEYFRFAVVRNPYKRIFSAWQSKLLLQEPHQINRYRDFDFFSLPVESKEDIRRAFEIFLVHLAENEAPGFWDVHWTPQFSLLRPDLIRYSAVSKIEDVSALELNLRTHLGERFISPFSMKRSNESLIPFSPWFISDKAASLIRELYALDFSMFGFEEEMPSATAVYSDDQVAVAAAAIRMLRGRHRRMGEIRERLRRDLCTMQQTVAERDSSIGDLLRAASKCEESLRGLGHVALARESDATQGVGSTAGAGRLAAATNQPSSVGRETQQIVRDDSPRMTPLGWRTYRRSVRAAFALSRRVISRLARLTWHCIPLGSARKASIKDFVFRHFGFAFRWSATYKSWKSCAQRRADI